MNRQTEEPDKRSRHGRFKYRFVLWGGVLSIILMPSIGWALHGGKHGDPIAPVILGVTGILFFAVLGRFAARRFNQPSVLGELLMGVAIGNVGYWLGSDFIEVLRQGPAVFDMVDLTLSGEPLKLAAIDALGSKDAGQILTILSGPGGPALTQVAHTVDVFSRYGVIFMLFLIGLETSPKEMRSVGGASFRVAIVGVVMPFVLGFWAARLLMPELSINVDLFVAATLGATSIGITARVLEELKLMHSREAHVILGAAVIDDILGLVMLAIVSGVIVAGSFDLIQGFKIIGLALLFLYIAFKAGPYFLRFTINLVQHLDIIEAKMFISFLFVMVLAWFANLAGLATIVGAFAAGVILHDAYFSHWGKPEEHRFCIRDLIAPLEVILVPIFFILMGIQVKLESFNDPHVIVMAGGLTLAAIIGKWISGYMAGKGANHLAVGIGMIPRGEVGLVFASIGKSLEVLNDELFSSLVLMVIITTLVTPTALKLTLKIEARS
ncbi:MAG: cation:proton antiporter [Proteobacteria bacterium]|jgi:Kef-type K+ transport system membrane component KefB|nr:cation:proton antiporter [Pseudomonadota bacterium]MCG6936001.1 cation:proton antiporter [Pseudomonadota bacterium]